MQFLGLSITADRYTVFCYFVEYKKNFERLTLQAFQNFSWVLRKHKALYVKIETKVSYLNK